MCRCNVMITGLHCNIYTSNFRGTMDLSTKPSTCRVQFRGRGSSRLPSYILIFNKIYMHNMVQSVVALIVSWRFASLSLPCFTKTRGWADRTCTHLIQFKPCRRLADHECRLRNSCLFMDMSSLTRAYWLTCRRIKVFVCLASREVHFEVTVGVMTPSMRSPQGKR